MSGSVDRQTYSGLMAVHFTRLAMLRAALESGDMEAARWQWDRVRRSAEKIARTLGVEDVR